MVVGAVALYLIQWRERETNWSKTIESRRQKLKHDFNAIAQTRKKNMQTHTLCVHSFRFISFYTICQFTHNKATAQHSTTNRHKPRNRKNAHNKKMCNRHPIWIHSFSHEYLLYTLRVEYELVSVSPA